MSQIFAHSLELDRTNDVLLDGNHVPFESLMLSENVLKGLKSCGFKKSSPIQYKAIPIGRCGFDIIIKSKSGTGKTLVYSVIALESIDIGKFQVQVVILAPTREIAVQIQEVLTALGSHFKDLKVASFIGGTPIEEDKKKCEHCHIAVGAPGRIKHLVTEGFLKLSSARLLVLDEVDKLMESSFQSDINEIFNSLPDRKQIISASATYPKDLNIFLCKYMLSPTYIEAETNTPLLLGLRQFIRIIAPYTSAVQELKFKNEEILHLFSTISFTQCIVFTNFQTRAESISNFLNRNGWTSTYISSAQSQIQRLKAVNSLKNFQSKIILSTDLTARGIDAAKVDLIINYDIPLNEVTYLHRMGRAGRFGSFGVCIDLVSTGSPLQYWKEIIGSIGGCTLGIPQLPEFQGTVLDLLKIEVSPEHYIFGVKSSTCTTARNDIKTKILNFNKCSKEKSHEVNEDITTYKHKEEYGVDSLVQQEYNMNCNRESKTTPDNYNRHIEYGGHEEENLLNDNVIEDCTFYKNKALLYVTQILSQKKIVDKSGLGTLDYYLKIIKKREMDEIMAVRKSGRMKDLIVVNDPKEEPKESQSEYVFEAGYNYVTKPDSVHWSSCLSDSEINKYQNMCLVGRHYQDEIDNFVESEGTSTKNSILSDELSNNQYSLDNRNSQVFKEISNKSSQEKMCVSNFGNSNWEYLSPYFYKCSELLWQSGLSFTNVEDFDIWFHNTWQKQVCSVRNYIQQNIYIQSMNIHQKL